MKPFLPLFLSISLCFILVILIPLFLLLKPLYPYAKYLLGTDKPITYLILLGNDTEMRANGGFAGSYAKITLSSSFTPLKINPTLDFQDIYVPNGQLEGHVTPPEPIQSAFGHGTWELANADWEPDFPTAATAIRWFLTKGGETDPDILAIVNLTTIKNILNIVGSFPVPEYSATITPDNLYLFLQGKSELGFFPGSTQKKDALLTVGKALVAKAKGLSLVQKIKIAHLIYSDLVNQNIVVNSSNSSFQSFLDQKNFSGVLKPVSLDNYSLIETNLGANKANAYVTRETLHTISATVSGQINHHVMVTLQNSSPESSPNPPFQYGGNYIAYLRFYIPSLAQNIEITSDESSPSAQITQKYGFTEVGFFHTTLAGTTSEVNLSYDLPLTNSKDYSLAILKQHGLITSPQEINLLGKNYSSPLTRSLFIPRL